MRASRRTSCCASTDLPRIPPRAATLRYFAEQVKTFSTQRIGLTSPNRRVVPLTRDYQYAAAQFAGAGDGFVAPVSYVDYTEGAEDLLAMCLTGFPGFDKHRHNAVR